MDLPEGFTPFEKLDIGSNVLIRGKVLIAIGEKPVLLVGKGAEPKIWLYGPRKGNGLGSIVQGNESLSAAVKVLAKSDAVSIYLGETLVMQVFKKSEDEASVTHLDLMPFGIAIKADLNALTYGTNQLLGNIFEGVETMIKLA